MGRVAGISALYKLAAKNAIHWSNGDSRGNSVLHKLAAKNAIHWSNGDSRGNSALHNLAVILMLMHSCLVHEPVEQTWGAVAFWWSRRLSPKGSWVPLPL